MNHGNYQKGWVCAFVASKGHRIERCLLERNMSSQRVCVKTPPTNSCSLTLAQLNPVAEAFHPLQAAAGDTSATGTQTNHTTC